MKTTKLLIVVLLIIALIVAVVLGVTCKSTSSGNDQKSSAVIINEIMMSNKGVIHDPKGESSDYIELKNISLEPVSLYGYLLSNQGVNNPKVNSWTFPDVTIEPGGLLLVWCTGDNSETELYTNFKLSGGEILTFGDSTGLPLLNIELPNDLHSGYSYCYNAQTGSFEGMLPSPGFDNTEEGIQAFQNSLTVQQGGSTAQVQHNGVYISEFMASNVNTLRCPDGEYNDWIELYNTTSTDVDLSGCGLTDDAAKPYKYTFPQGTIIKANDFLLVYETAIPVEGYLCIDFGLSSSGEYLQLINAEGGVLDSITFGTQTKNYSFARNWDTRGSWTTNGSDFYACDIPSPGYENTYQGNQNFFMQSNPDLGVHDIKINEILVEGYYYKLAYNSKTKSDRPTDYTLGNWIELRNDGDYAVQLGGYSLTDNNGNPTKWVFPEGTSIAAKGYLILLLEGGNSPEGEDNNGNYLSVNFDISGAGEGLYLYSPDGVLFDMVEIPACHSTISYGRDGAGNWVEFETPTPNAQNGGVSKQGHADMPTLSVQSGLYHQAQQVSITAPEGCYVTYTTDCTEPSQSSTRYTSTLNVTQNTVIRARAYASDGSTFGSDIVSNTYIIVDSNNQTQEAHDITLPMVFVVTEPENLWNTTYGIYVLGNDYTGKGEPTDITETGDGLYENFGIRGRCWERASHFTYLSNGGEDVLFESDLMIRIFGAFSRKVAQKGIALIPRKGYGATSLNYAFFDDRPFESYESLVLRASGQDAKVSRFKDVLIHGLMNDANVDIAVQAYVQCVVYLNGQYWGVYNLREKVSKFYVAQHYGIEDVDTIDMLKGNGTNEGYVVCGDGLQDYKDLIEFCKSKNYDLSNASDYAYVTARVDVENYALYAAQQIIVGNTDTGNIKWWRSSELDNKWRWLCYDYCWAMNGGSQSADVTTTSGYSRDFFWRYFDPAGHGAGKGFSTELGRSLLSNNDFVEIFLRQCAYLFNEVYTPEKIFAKSDELKANIYDEMVNWDIARWAQWNNQSVNGWESHSKGAKIYAENFQPYYLKYCKNFINEHTNYNLTDQKMIELFGRTA